MSIDTVPHDETDPRPPLPLLGRPPRGDREEIDGSLCDVPLGDAVEPVVGPTERGSAQ